MSDVPFGTGTAFALEPDSDTVLCRQSRTINITEREEGIVAQFLATRTGHKVLLEAIESELASPEQYRLERIFSGVHAGQGRLWFGSSRHQLCDFTLFFRGPPGKPVVLYYINYHGGFYHYTGHFRGCRFRGESDDSDAEDEPCYDEKTKRLDELRRDLASFASELAPEKFLVKYKSLNACQLFHLEKEYDLEEFLERENPKYCCLPRRESLWRKSWHVDHLVEKILEGEVTGFVTLEMGFEDQSLGCLLEKNFGFCVQKKRPKEGDLSDFTLAQIALREDLKDAEQVKTFIAKAPERTLAAKSFFACEETISTTYFTWLVRERGLFRYKITHFLHYKFSDYSKDFLEPILERRHVYKREKKSVGAETLKLVANGSFGYTALESRNYDTTVLKTDLSLKKNRFKMSANFSMKNISFVGIVKSRGERKRKREASRSKRCKKKRRRRSSFVADEAIEDNNDEEEEEEEEADLSADEEEDALDFDQDVLKRVDLLVEEDEDDDDDYDGSEEEGDLEECLTRGEKEKERVADFKFLYTATVSGKYKKISNCIPRAVAILSNSKKIFLGLVIQLLRASDPAKVEPVYCDTDSIILSCSHSRLEDNLKPGGREALESAQIIGREDSKTSIHGKLKLEGVFCSGFFRALKVYRLFEEVELEEELELEEVVNEARHPEMRGLKSVYTRCKGISRNLANLVETDQFAPSPNSRENLQVHKSSLRPTRAGEMIIQLERKTLAQPYNYKRRVDEFGIHSFPFE